MTLTTSSTAPIRQVHKLLLFHKLTLFRFRILKSKTFFHASNSLVTFVKVLNLEVFGAFRHLKHTRLERHNTRRHHCVLESCIRSSCTIAHKKLFNGLILLRRIMNLLHLLSLCPLLFPKYPLIPTLFRQRRFALKRRLQETVISACKFLTALKGRRSHRKL